MTTYTITLNNPHIATEAGEWCNSQFGEGAWNINMPEMFKPVYIFLFTDPKHATEFALRWV